MANKNFLKEFNANDNAVAGAIKVLVWLIILGVVVYSEIMFLGIVSVIFPTGVLRIGAIVGAVATGASVIALYAGKSKWFHPGPQLIAAWIFTGVEVAVLILNDILAFSLHNGTVDGYLALWYAITPAGPVIALVGWGIILYLDPARAEKHLDMQIERKKADMERNYELAAFHAQMQIRTSHLNQVTAQLDNVMSSPAVQRQIAEHANRMVAQVLTDMSGIHAMSHMPKIIDAPSSVSLNQEAHTSPLAHPQLDTSVDQLSNQQNGSK